MVQAVGSNGATMKAVDFAKGSQKIVDTPKPEPRRTEVLVKVACSALDTAAKDVINKTMAGGYIHAKGSPLVVGWHYSGIVELVGSEVQDFKPGDEVYGFLQYSDKTKQGTMSEYVTVPAAECAVKPRSVSMQIAAGAATETITALQCLREGGTKEGSTVLVVGAGGGVGEAAVQIAKRLGAHVTAICSTKDVQRVTSLGADVVVDRKQKDPFAMEQRFDVVFDSPTASPGRYCKLANPKGAYIATKPTAEFLSTSIRHILSPKKVAFVMVRARKEDLQLVGSWLADGMIVTIDSTFKVHDIAAALKRQETSSKIGRVVVDVESGW